MKKLFIVMIALLTAVAFVSVSGAADKPKAMSASGAVVKYEAGKTITIKGEKADMAFKIAADAKVTGEIKEGAKVTVSYTKAGDEMTATAISAGAAKEKK